MPVKAGYLLAAGLGGIVLYSGIKGHKWTTTLRGILSGQGVPQTDELAISTSPAAFASTGSGPDSAGTGPLPLGGTVAKNKAIGRAMAAAYGWATGPEWDALDALWTQESGWNNRAKNPTSTAYGIPQALHPADMGPLANPPISSAGAQIRWGLRYIKTRWGTPSNAWGGYHQRGNWY